MILFVVGTITTLNPSFKESLDIAKKLPANSAVDVYINSSGGRIDEAFYLGRELVRLNATCYVKLAASAAFEVVLPACRRLVITKETRFIFHSATTCVEAMVDTADALADLRLKLQINAQMASLMESTWGPGLCTKGLKDKYPEIKQLSCSVIHMLDETELTGLELTRIFPGAANRINLAPKEAFPSIPAANDPIQSAPNANFTCEVY